MPVPSQECYRHDLGRTLATGLVIRSHCPRSQETLQAFRMHDYYEDNVHLHAQDTVNSKASKVRIHSSQNMHNLIIIVFASS